MDGALLDEQEGSLKYMLATSNGDLGGACDEERIVGL